MSKRQPPRQPRRPRNRQPPAGQRRGSRQQSRGQRNAIGGWSIALGAAVVVLAAAGLAYAGTRSSSSSTPTPSASSTPRPLARPVDGISCGAMEQLAYHIHQHLTLYDHGKQLPVPSEIGIPGGEYSGAGCYYWIHVHALDPNIIHVESPIQKTFTLGNFFDIWKATRTSASPPGDAYVLRLEAAAKNGQVTAFYNGKRWTRGYRSIPLTDHAVITVEIGKPVLPPRPFTDWSGL